MLLEFSVRGQQIFRADKTPLASDSRLYIAGKVTFDAEWDDITAVYLNFEPSSGEAINAYLTDGAFAESLGVSLSAGSWRVSAHGSNSAGKEIHTTTVTLNVDKAGGRDGEAPPYVPPDAAGQIAAVAAEARETANQAMELAEQSGANAESAAKSAESAAKSAESTALYANTAANSAGEASNAVSRAEGYANSASSSESAAAYFASDAQNQKVLAESAASEANYYQSRAAQAVNDIYQSLNGYVPKSDYSPTEKTAAMTQPVGKDANGKLWTAPTSGGSSGGGSSIAVDETLTLSGAAADAKAVGDKMNEIDADIDGLRNNNASGSGVSVAISEAGASPFKTLIVEANTDMPNDGNRDNPVTIGYSSGVTVTYPDGETQVLEPSGKLYAIKGPWSTDFAKNRRDWASKKDINKVFRYIFTGDEALLQRNTHIFELPIYSMTDCQTPNAAGSKRIAVSTHYTGTSYKTMYDLRNADDTLSIDGMVSAYGYVNSNNEVTNKVIMFCDHRFSTRDEFKVYLKEQFNAGTPVEVAYITRDEYEEDIPDADYQLFREFVLRGGDCTVTNDNGCSIVCEYWKDFLSKNYIDWADSMKSGGGTGIGSMTFSTPEMFGAVGDGVADDTKAIQAALDSGMAVFCGKNYKFSTLSLGNGSTELFSSGQLISTSSDCAIRVTASNCRIRIKNLKCTNGILFDGSLSGCSVDDATIIFTGQYGVKLNADAAKIICCTFRNVKCKSTNEGNGYGFWLSNDYTDAVYSYCNQHMFWNCVAEYCEVGAYLFTKDTYTDKPPIGDRMNCIFFDNFNPEGCTLGLHIENFVNRSKFTEIRNNEFTGSAAGWKPVVKLVGVSRGNVFSTTGLARYDMIGTEQYEYSSDIDQYLDGTYHNYFEGNMMSKSAGLLINRTCFALVSDGAGGLRWTIPARSVGGCQPLPTGSGNGYDDYMSMSESTDHSNANINAAGFMTKADATESPRLHLTPEVMWDIRVLVVPELPPIVVYDASGNILFDVRDNMPTSATVYTIPCSYGINAKHFITQEKVYTSN